MPRACVGLWPRLAALVAACLALAGCAGPASLQNEAADDTLPAGYTLSGFSPQALASLHPVALAGAAPLAALPPQAGAVTGVSERRARYWYFQRIGLKGDNATFGQNRIEVVVHYEALAPRLSQQELAAAMQSEFPQTAMQFSNALVQNAYGPFGYAFGRAGATNCLFAWQQIDKVEASGNGWLDPRRSMTVKVRLCQAGRSESDLVGLLRAMRLAAMPAEAQTLVDAAAPDALATPLAGGSLPEAENPIAGNEALPVHRRIARRRPPEAVATVVPEHSSAPPVPMPD